MSFLRRFSDPRFRAQQLEILIGLLGFFTVVSLALAVSAEVRGEPALHEAAVLLLFAVLTGLAIWGRRRALDQIR